MTTMKAARLNVRTHQLTLDEVPIPEPGTGEVRIAVKAAGVCLSDVHLVQGVLRPRYLESDEVTLGHEVAGVIDALGPEVTELQIGQRVLLQAGHRTPAGRALARGVDYDGGYAEFAIAKAQTVVPIPDSLSFEQAAIIPDAVSTPWAAISVTAQVHAGQAVGVWGLGGLGTHAVQLLRLAGAAPIIAIDPLPAARERVAELGADVVAAPEDAAAAIAQAAPQGLAVALDFAGVPAVRAQALESLGQDGRLVIVGLADRPIEIPADTTFAVKGQQVAGHYGSDGLQVLELVRLAGLGRFDLSGSITDTFPLDEAPAVIERLERKEGNPIRFVLHP